MFNFIYLFLITRLIFCRVFGLYVSQRCETMALIHDRRLLFWFFRCLLQMLFVAQGHVAIKKVKSSFSLRKHSLITNKIVTFAPAKMGKSCTASSLRILQDGNVAKVVGCSGAMQTAYPPASLAQLARARDL